MSQPRCECGSDATGYVKSNGLAFESCNDCIPEGAEFIPLSEIRSAGARLAEHYGGIQDEQRGASVEDFIAHAPYLRP